MHAPEKRPREKLDARDKRECADEYARYGMLPAFQKKSTHGIATPPPEIDLITRRVKQAIAISEGKE